MTTDPSRSPGSRTRTARRVLVLAVSLAACFALVPSAWAVAGQWSSDAAATLGLRSATLDTPSAPTVNRGSSAVITWSASRLSTGAAVTDYVVTRTDTAGVTTVCTTAQLTCTDASATGTVTYRVVARYQGWTSTPSAGTTSSTTVDTTAPSAPAGLRLSDDGGSSSTDGIVSVARQTLTGDVEAGATVTVRVDETIVATVVAGGDGRFSALLGTLGAGGHNVRVSVRDAAGNQGPDTNWWIVVDLTAPTLQVNHPIAGKAYTLNDWRWSTCTGGGGVCGSTADDRSGPALVETRFRDTTAARCFDGSGFSTGACAAFRAMSGTHYWIEGVPVEVMTAGHAYSFQVRVADVAGNVTLGPLATFSFTG